jgi:hypothetical protein
MTRVVGGGAAPSRFEGLDGTAFGGEVFVEWVVREGAEAGDDGFGVEDGAGHGRVGVRVAEERVDGGFAESVIAAGDDLIEVDEGDVLFFGDGLGPAAVGLGIAADVALDPDFARDKRAEDGRGAFSADVLDVLAEVPAEGVDEFGLVRVRVLYLEGLVAGAGQAAADVGAMSAGVGGRGGGAGKQALVGYGFRAGEIEAAVVVAELDEDEVAGLNEFERIGPVALRDVGVGREAADGAVDNVDFGGVEKVGNGCAPAPEAVGAFAVSVADGRVADEDEGREFGVGRAGETEVCLLCAGVHGWAARTRRGGRGFGRC